MHLGAIADDVTGGSDLASVLRRAGLTVVQTLGLPRSPLPPADAVVISLKTRMAAVSTATGQATAAADAFSGFGAPRLYFKYCSTFDSTDTGNIGPVIEVLLAKAQAPFTIACPAYPALGRTSYLGHLFVGDRLLSESSMRHHPLTPMADADLVRVLGRQTRLPVALVPLADVERGEAAVRRRMDALVSTGCRVALVDAIFDRHVDTIAAACADLPFVTGGAALGGALGRRIGRDQRLVQKRHAVVAIGAPLIVLSGSCSAATREQVRRLADQIPSRAVEALRLFEHPGELGNLIDWAREQSRRGSVLLFSTDRPEAVHAVQTQLGRRKAAELLEDAFGQIASALAATGARTFVVAGGETAGAVLESLDVGMVEFGDDVAPGVPWMYSIDPEGFTFALKSGNFGSPDFFLKALEEAP
jgi:3-dehydrotetronate 4-kinase